MKEEDLLKFLIFIAEEDAQISTIINFFIDKLGYDVTTIKIIVIYGVNNNIFKLVKNDENLKNYTILKSDEIEKIDWSISNTINEIYYNDYDYYRKELFVSQPQIPMEFKQFILKDNM